MEQVKMKSTLLLILVGLFQSLEQAQGNPHTPNCLPGHDTDDELAFSETPGNMVLTCKRSYVDLFCCVQGYTSMKWMRKIGSIWMEVKINPLRYYQQNDKNQTLSIQSPYESDDEGHYMCIAEGKDNKQLNNTVWLDVRECEGREEAPVALMPEYDGTIERALGSSVKINCIGFFGIGHHKTYSAINWYKTQVNETGFLKFELWVPQYNRSMPQEPNIRLTYDTSEPAHIKSALHITNITENDLANYTCLFMNVINSTSRTIELVEGKNDTVVIFKHKDVGKEWKFVVIGIAVALAVICILSLVAFIYRLDMKLFYRDRVARVTDDGKEYDAFVVYNSAVCNDRKFATDHLRKVLENQHGYKLYLEDRDFPVGDPAADVWVRGAGKSRCIMFLMSPDLLREEWVDFLYQATASRTDITRVFFMYRPVTDSHWQSHQEAFKTAFKVAKRKVRWPHDTSPQLMTMDSSNMKSYNTMSKREEKFWKELRWALPKPLSLIRKDSQSTNMTSLSNITSLSNGFKSQSSTSSNTPLTNSKQQTSPYAFEVI